MIPLSDVPRASGDATTIAKAGMVGESARAHAASPIINIFFKASSPCHRGDREQLTRRCFPEGSLTSEDLHCPAQSSQDAAMAGADDPKLCPVAGFFTLHH